jgi:hypothetical protein
MRVAVMYSIARRPRSLVLAPFVASFSLPLSRLGHISVSSRSAFRNESDLDSRMNSGLDISFDKRCVSEDSFL